MVNGEWNKIKLICGNHNADIAHEMQLQQGREGMSVFYACPCYHTPDVSGRKCNNRLNIVDFEGMVSTLFDESMGEDGNDMNLRGFQWHKKGVEYCVLAHDGTGFTVMVKNRKAIGK